MENQTGIADVILILGDSLTPKGIEQWLHAVNGLLDGRRPIDLIDQSDAERVKQAAQRSWMAPTSDPRR